MPKPLGYTEQKRAEREAQEAARMNLWRLFYELRELQRALDQMPQHLLVQNAKERAEIIERCADSLYR